MYRVIEYFCIVINCIPDVVVLFMKMEAQPLKYINIHMNMK